MHTCTHSTLHILSNFFLCIHAKVIRVLCYPIRVGRWTCGRERQKDQSSSLDYLLVLHSLYVINWCNFPASHSVHRLSRCHRRCAGLCPWLPAVATLIALMRQRLDAPSARDNSIDAPQSLELFGHWFRFLFFSFFFSSFFFPFFLVSFYISARAGLRECPRTSWSVWPSQNPPKSTLTTTAQNKLK